MPDSYPSAPLPGISLLFHVFFTFFSTYLHVLTRFFPLFHPFLLSFSHRVPEKFSCTEDLSSQFVDRVGAPGWPGYLWPVPRRWLFESITNPGVARTTRLSGREAQEVPTSKDAVPQTGPLHHFQGAHYPWLFSSRENLNREKWSSLCFSSGWTR
jgi:hypothetical protein